MALVNEGYITTGYEDRIEEDIHIQTTGLPRAKFY